MSHISATAILVWAVMSVLLTGFLLFHLWSFDRFKCLKWNNGPYSGAFKRVMTYSYLASLPLFVTFAVGFTVIKYQEGYISHPTLGIIPKPWTLWSQANQNAIFPLHLLFSIGWSLEMVTHLEELCFWLFLVNSSAAKQDWFKSLYFRTWVVGSIIAITYMPLITVFTRDEPLKNEAYTFLAGSLGSFSITIWFLPVLWTFPTFLDGLRREGVDVATMVRLTKFNELNLIRVIFRFIMVVPLVVLGADGVKPHSHTINESQLWTDLLVIVSAFGCGISSVITLIIFFPRSVEGEINTKDAAKERKQRKKLESMSDRQSNHSRPTTSLSSIAPGDERRGSTYKAPLQSMSGTNMDGLSELPLSPYIRPPSYHYHPNHGRKSSWNPYANEEERLPAMRPNRFLGGSSEIELGGIDRMTEGNVERRPSDTNPARNPNVHPVLHNFKSPLDIAHGYSSEEYHYQRTGAQRV